MAISTKIRRTPRMAAAKPRLLAPLTLVVFGSIAAYMSFSLQIGTFSKPEPGLWPFIVSILILGTSVALFVKDRPEDYELWERSTLRVLAGLGALAGYIVLFQVFGFLISSSILLFTWMVLICDEPWKASVVFAICGALVFQAIFVNALGVPFPVGILGVG